MTRRHHRYDEDSGEEQTSRPQRKKTKERNKRGHEQEKTEYRKIEDQYKDKRSSEVKPQKATGLEEIKEYKSPERKRKKHSSGEKKKKRHSSPVKRKNRNSSVESYNDSPEMRKDRCSSSEKSYDSPVIRKDRRSSPEKSYYSPKRRKDRQSSPGKRNESHDALPVRRQDQRNSHEKRNSRHDSSEKKKNRGSSLEKRNVRGDSSDMRTDRRNSVERRNEKSERGKDRWNTPERRNERPEQRKDKWNSPERRNERRRSTERINDKWDNRDSRNERRGTPDMTRKNRYNSFENRDEHSSPTRRPYDKSHRTERINSDSEEAHRHRRDPQPNLRTNRDAEITEPETVEKEPPLSKTKISNINLRSGGAYIPPAKLKMLQDQITDKSSIEYQRLAWEALKKSLTGLTNKVNSSNIAEVVREIFKENVIRGRGVLVRAITQAQAMSPTFTHVYAALVAIINSKFPNISELLLKRLLIQFKRGFRRNDKPACISSTRFVSHLLNQQVTHELVVLEMLTLLLENPTDDSMEIAIAMIKECGKKMTEVSSKGVMAIFDRLKHILNEVKLDKRVQYMIEVMFAIRKDKFKDYEVIAEGLDLVEEDDKYTHLMTLEEATDAEEILNVFKFDENYLNGEELYRGIRKELLGEGSGSDESGSSGDESGSDEEAEEAKAEETVTIHDMTETSLVALRRNIYLTIQSSLDFEECAHKLLKMEFNPGQIEEMCYMILDCCAQQRTYEKFYGLLAQRFCQLNKIYVEPFTEIFRNSYETIHRLETNKLRNVAKFFAHLLYTDAISWLVLANIKLNEDDTTSSNRIFIKILFQDLSEFMGLKKLFDRVKDPTLQEAFDGLFPRDNPRNTRFAINFFTSIGLGGLTDELREHLKTMPKNIPVNPVFENPEVKESSSSSDSSSSSSSSSSTSSSSSSSSSESEESDDSPERRPKSRKNKAKELASKTKQRQQKNRTHVQKHHAEKGRPSKHKVKR